MGARRSLWRSRPRLRPRRVGRRGRRAIPPRRPAAESRSEARRAAASAAARSRLAPTAAEHRPQRRGGLVPPSRAAAAVRAAAAGRKTRRVGTRGLLDMPPHLLLDASRVAPAARSAAAAPTWGSNTSPSGATGRPSSASSAGSGRLPSSSGEMAPRSKCAPQAPSGHNGRDACRGAPLPAPFAAHVRRDRGSGHAYAQGHCSIVYDIY